MINYRKYFFLSKRYIHLFNKNFIFNSFINILFLSTLIFCFTTIVLTTSINEGFKKEIQKKIINLDGYIRIYNKHSLPLNDSDLVKLKKTIFERNNQIEYSKLISTEAIIKTSNGTEGVLINLIENNGLNVFNLKEYIILGEFNEKSITIGSMLAKKLSIKVNDYIYLLNHYSNNVESVRVSAIFETNISNYDKHTVYTGIHSFKDFFNYTSDTFESIVINSKGNKLKMTDFMKSDNFNYVFVTWKDRFDSFLLWLFSYDIPIKVLLLFILIVSLLNISSSVYLDLLFNKKNNTLLYIFGLKKKEFIIIYLFKNFYIYIIGSIFSYILIKLFIYIQMTYEVISIPKNIYMLSSVPINFNIFYFIYLFFILLVSISCITMLSAKFIFNFNNPSRLVKK